MPNARDTFIWRIVNLDPALLRGLVVALFLVLGSAGILVSPQIGDSFVMLWVAVMAIVQAIWTRGAVTANARVAVLVPDPVHAPNTVAAGAASTAAPANEIVEAARTAVL